MSASLRLQMDASSNHSSCDGFSWLSVANRHHVANRQPHDDAKRQRAADPLRAQVPLKAHVTVLLLLTQPRWRAPCLQILVTPSTIGDEVQPCRCDVSSAILSYSSSAARFAWRPVRRQNRNWL